MKKKDIELQKKEVDDFNNFALNFKDYKGNPFFISDREGKIYMNPKCEATYDQLHAAYSSHLKKK